jgi:hypothetical protein
MLIKISYNIFNDRYSISGFLIIDGLNFRTNQINILHAQENLWGQLAVGFIDVTVKCMGIAVAQWLMYCATVGDCGSTVVKVLCYSRGPR